jgi:hypothetical protein
MALVYTAKPQSSSGTQEALELLLSILPNTHQLTELLDAEPKKPAIRFRNLITHFQAATFLLCEHLGKLKSADAVDNGANVIHKAALCLEKIASPKHVPINLQKVLVS